MAKIAFVSLYDRNAYGMRIMSSLLQKAGHECHIIFLKEYNSNPTFKLNIEVDEYPWIGVHKNGKLFKYAANSLISRQELLLLKDEVERIKPDLLGLTVNTPLRKMATQVSYWLKEHFDTPLIWGGYDPTVNLKDCLNIADYVCVGEADQTILDIAERLDNKQGLDDVPNLAFMHQGNLITNAKHPAEQNLDTYPWRDDSPKNKSFIENNEIVHNYTIVNDLPQGHYNAISARGCPYKCTYCCEATLKETYKGEKFLRRRSPEDFVAELAYAKELHGLNRIQIFDEIFAMDLKWLEQFATLYQEQVNLPFSCFIYPVNNIEKILTLLKQCGLIYCCLALESGSQKINKKVFQRVYNRDLFVRTARICQRLEIPYYTDIITYNPYEDEQDLIDTLDVLTEIGGPFEMCINKLFVLPGTKMAEMMKADNIDISDDSRDKLFNYYCRLYWVASFSAYSKYPIAIVRKIPLFKKYPRLVQPLVFEAMLNPKSWAIGLIKTLFPQSIVNRLKTAVAKWRRLRQKLSQKDASAELVRS